jgi:hypothetical protein
MSNERTVKLGDSRAQSSSNMSRGPSPQLVTKRVTFIDSNGRIWTVELDLPGNINMDTMLQIAKANISLMNNERDIHIDDLCVLVEPEEKDEMFLEDVDRVVIFHKNKLNQIERR